VEVEFSSVLENLVFLAKPTIIMFQGFHSRKPDGL